MKKRIITIIAVSVCMASLLVAGCSKTDKDLPESESPQEKQQNTSEITEKKDLYCLATDEEMQDYMNDDYRYTFLVDARSQDSYAGWALNEDQMGGHLKNSFNFPARWIDCDYETDERENKTHQEAIQKILDANMMEKTKNYIIYDTNGEDSKKVSKYLKEELGFENVCIYNAKDLINDQKVKKESYANYELYVPAEVVKNISDHIVSKKELSAEAKKIVKKDNVIILEVSWGDETSDAVSGSGYAQGHVPGAIHVGTDEFETPRVYVPEKKKEYATEWRLNSDKELLKLAEAKGITKDSCVIITAKEPMAAARMGIILKYLGTENVHVMSEGMTGWSALGYELEKGVNKPQKSNFGFDKPQNPDVIDTIDEVRQELRDKNYQVIDTRTSGEWKGESSGYDYHDLKGRIKGTVSSPSGVGYSSSMWYYRNPDKSMRTKFELDAMWERQGIDTDKHLVFFCGSGWRAAEETWDAWVMGYDASLYSDGWIGWSNEGNPYIDKNGNTVHYDKNIDSVVK